MNIPEKPQSRLFLATGAFLLAGVGKLKEPYIPVELEEEYTELVDAYLEEWREDGRKSE